jgi:hydrogenase maturation protease
VIIGVGQPYGGDDGVGRVVAQHLRAAGTAAAETADGVGLLALLGAVGDEPVVVVDAAVGVGPPGTVVALRADALEPARTLSSHGLSVREALELARVLRSAPLDLHIVAIAVAAPRDRGAGLSAPVAAAVPVAAELARALAR